jgi:hypothetical protein
MENERARNLGVLVIGLGLIALGALFFLAQVFHISLLGILWPFFIIVPGLLFFVGMVALGPNGAPLAVPGSIVTMVGLILLFQSVTGLWATWAYVWALIFPTAVGVGIAIAGLWGGDAKTARFGSTLATVGLVVFAVFGIFFELLINLNGLRSGVFGGIMFPALLIVGGLIVLLLAVFPRRRMEH